MYGAILGFHRRVWWPKWTPASSRWRMLAVGIGIVGPYLRLSRRRKKSVLRAISEARHRSGAAGRQRPRPCVRYRKLTYGAQAPKTSPQGRPARHGVHRDVAALLAQGGAECHLLPDESVA